MKRREFRITLPVKSPALCAGLAQKAFGLDASFIRNEEGKPIIPRDHLKGLVREALEMLRGRAGIDDKRINEWLGSPPQTGDYEPRQGRVIFDDLVLEDEASEDAVFNRVKVDEEKGSAEKGALLFIEQIAPPGKEMMFTGTVTAFLGDDEKFATALEKALKLIPAAGAMKSAGFGEVVPEHVDVEEETPAARPADDLPEGDVLMFDVTFDRPVLFDAIHEADNVVAGSPVIPGGAIKGALAWLLGLKGENPQDNETLSRMVVSHAFPLDESGEKELEHPFPLCMASFSGEAADFACDLGGGGGGIVRNGRVPFYPPDWKEKVSALARAHLGYPPAETLRRLQRTRAELKDGVAKNEKLFAEVAISERIKGGGEKRRWRFTIARNGADAAEFRRLAGIVRSGLWNMGRTNAAMTVERIANAAPAGPEPFDEKGDAYAVMLLTPAVMTDAKTLGESGEWSLDARNAFAAYWKNVIPGAELVDFMAAQSWGGRYAARRYRPYGGGIYYPFMLTMPGSVFLLRGDGVKEALETCITGNLPHAPLGGKTPDWRKSPFVPENGYGRIRCVTRTMIGEGRGNA